MIADCLQDLRYGARVLLKNPSFALIAVITLALGIGANTAIFSVVNAVLLRPLPFEESDRLMMVTMANPRQGESRLPLSVADFLDWRAQNQVFADLAAFTDNWFSLTGEAGPERLRGAYVTAGFFSTLRVQPLLGRTFAAEEDEPGRTPLVVLSHRLWQRRFNSDPQIVGRAVSLSGRSRTIIGVMPDGFQFPPDDKNSLPGKVDLWVVHTLDPPPRRGPYYLQGIARLKPEAMFEQAQAELETIGLHIQEANPLSNAETTLTAVSLKDALVGDVRVVLLVLLGAVAFVLLIASVNVANLSLVRAAARQKEIAIRAALGAGCARLIRQLLAESLLLAAVGAAVGLLLAFWLVDLLITLGPSNLPRLAEVKIDYRVLGFTGAVALLTGMLFGLAPAWQGARAKLNESLKEGRQRSAEGSGGQRARNLFVISEVALSLVLLIGAGLMLNSFLRLQRVSPGFKPANILTMQVSLPNARYKEAHQINGFYQQLLERVGSLPSVQSTGIGMSLASPLV